MSQNSAIEWTETTWNPLAGCTEISPGCANCYAVRMANRQQGMGTPKYAGTVTKDARGALRWSGRINLDDAALREPLRWRKSRLVFVNSMSDLFHQDVPVEFIAKVFAIMALAKRLTFQLLTKRADRMRAVLSDPTFLGRVESLHETFYYDHFGTTAESEEAFPGYATLPLPNVWLGVSVENQHFADERIPQLLATPAAIRWLSCEPLLGPVNLTIMFRDIPDCDLSFTGVNTLIPSVPGQCGHRNHGHLPRIDWVIVGGESGPGSRPMHPQWARSLRDQCVDAGVQFLFKQWGEHSPCPDGAWHGLGPVGKPPQLCIDPVTGDVAGGFLGDLAEQRAAEGWAAMQRVGKHNAGRLLDGRTWDQYPEVAR